MKKLIIFFAGILVGIALSLSLATYIYLYEFIPYTLNEDNRVSTAYMSLAKESSDGCPNPSFEYGRMGAELQLNQYESRLEQFADLYDLIPWADTKLMREFHGEHISRMRDTVSQAEKQYETCMGI